MEASIGLVLVVVIVILLWRPMLLTTSDANKQEAAILLDNWARDHQYSLLHKSFLGREWYSSKQLRYEVYIKDSEGKQRMGTAICFILGGKSGHDRVEVSWGIAKSYGSMRTHE